MNRHRAFRILSLMLAAYLLFYVAGLNAKIREAGDRIDDLESEVSQCEYERSSLEDRIEEAEGRIDDLEEYSHYH